MNIDIYKFVKEVVNNRNIKASKEDLIQDVLLILIKKELIDSELKDELKGIIIGIIRNQSIKQFEKETKEANYPENFDLSNENEENHRLYLYDLLSDKEENDILNQHLKKIKNYIFENYYLRDRTLNKWKVFFLKYKGFTSKEIMKRLNFKDTGIVNKIYNQAIEEIEKVIESNYTYKPYYMKKNESRIDKKIVMCDMDNKLIKEYNTYKEVAIDLNVNPKSIYYALIKHKKSLSRKYIFHFAEDYFAA